MKTKIMQTFVLFFVLLFFFVLVMNTASCNRQPIELKEEEHKVFQLPSLYINISPEELGKVISNPDYKTKAQALLVTVENDTLFQGELDHIKTRGNSTRSFLKKSFTMKIPWKQKMLGLDKGRSFVLLANSMDESYIRNTIAFDLAKSVGLFAPKYHYIKLIINGQYWGLYQMTNKIDVSKQSIPITDLDNLNKQINSRLMQEYIWFGYGRNGRIIQRKGFLLDQSPEDVSGGYLLDNSGMDWIYCKSNSGFVSDGGDPIRIRSPKYASPDEINYIANFYNQMERSVMAVDGKDPRTGKHYSEFMDVRSFARYYLLNELLLNEDGGFASFFMYKDSDSIDSKLYAGPVWDFDISLNSPRSSRGIVTYNEIYVSAEIGKFGEPHSGGLLFYLWKHEDFRLLCKKIYYQDVSPSCHKYLNNGILDSLVDNLCFYANQDEALYKTRKSKSYRVATKTTIDFLRKRLEFLDWYFSSSQDEQIIICYQNNNLSPHERKIQIIYPVGKPVYTPTIHNPIIYNHEPIPVLYIKGTDSLVPDGHIFHSARTLEIRFRDPSRREIQKRRVFKRLNKWGIISESMIP